MSKKSIMKYINALKCFIKTQKLKKLGVTVGKNFNSHDVNIDKGHGYLIDIGDDCVLTHCTILAHDASTKRALGKCKVGRVTIGDRVFVGMHSIILPNVTIGNDCIIAAGSVVTKSVPENSVVAGNPAKCITNTDSYLQKHREDMKEKPVFSTGWRFKSNEQKAREKELLNEILGYDE